MKPAAISIVAGGTFGRAGACGPREACAPRVDVMEMSYRYPAKLFDFNALPTGYGLSVRSNIAHLLADRFHQESAALAAHVLPCVAQSKAIYATGEDVGLPLAALFRLHHISRPRLVMRMEQPTYGHNALLRSIHATHLSYALDRLDAILCRTNAHRQVLNSIFHVPLEKLLYVPESTDLGFWNKSAYLRSPSESGTRDEPLLLSAGLEMRDYDTLIAATRDLPINVIIAAGSPWSHSRRVTDRRGLPANVTVASYSRIELRDLYRRAAVVVVPVKPTLRACGMNVVLEAWAMETPVIVSRTIGLMDYIHDGINGLFFEPGDAAGLRVLILEILKNRTGARSITQNAKQTVAKYHSLDNYVQRVHNVLLSASPTIPAAAHNVAHRR